jgi:hypothetical protein
MPLALALFTLIDWYGRARFTQLQKQHIKPNTNSASNVVHCIPDAVSTYAAISLRVAAVSTQVLWGKISTPDLCLLVGQDLGSTDAFDGLGLGHR